MTIGTKELDEACLALAAGKAYLTVKDIQSLAGVTERVVLRWLNSKELRGWNAGIEPGSRKPRWRVARADWESFVAGRTTAPAPATTRRKTQPAPTAPDFFQGM
jgi:hypothetical protein